MAKLILSLDGAHLSEYPLTKVRTTIGRRPANDIHLDNLAVSGEHAVIVKTDNDFYVEDLDSTNGTLVNNEVTKKRSLQHGDVIAFGKFQLKYLDDATSNDVVIEDGESAFEETMLIRPSTINSNKPKLHVESALPTGQGAEHSAADDQLSYQSVPTSVSAPTAASTVADKVGRIQVLNGSNSGRELVLNKALTTLGKTGVHVAVITKRPNGYFITHVEGQVLPIVNGVSTGTQAFALNDHDVVELAGVKMEFYLTNS